MSKNKLFIIFSSFLLIISAIVFVSANLVYGKVFPNFFVEETSISSMNIDDAKRTIDRIYNPTKTIKLITKDDQFLLNYTDIDLSYNIDETILNAYGKYRNGGIITYSKGFVDSLFNETSVKISYDYNEEKLSGILSAIAAQVENEPVNPSARIENSEIIINSGEKGTRIEKESLINEINNSIELAKHDPIIINVKDFDPTLTNDEQLKYYDVVEDIKNISINLIVGNEEVVLETNDILVFLDHQGNPLRANISSFVSTFSQNNNKEPQNSIFNFEDGVVKEFVPSRNGVMIDINKFEEVLFQTLTDLIKNDSSEFIIEVPTKSIPPKITTDQVNNLGIKELIGVGSSTFKGSIASRIHNIGVASDQFNGTLVKPGEVLSFNEILGDVSEYTGYKKAYVIKNGQTVLGDGGGVCQVSTTLFRAALDAGLPIVERRAHSYRVTYYEQGFPPGLDATVYAPTTDLKIKNDTPDHLLVQTIYDPVNATLDIEFYGTSDGRVSVISDPVTTSSTPPPEDLYIDDPTLPSGEVKQIDWKAWGARVNFDYTVTRDGETLIEKTFYSNFQPWQAKFLRGTANIN